MKKLITVVLLSALVMLAGCLSDKKDSPTSKTGEMVKQTAAQYQSNAKRAASNGVQNGIYLSVNGSYQYYSFEALFLMNLTNFNTFLGNFGASYGETTAASFVVVNDAAVSVKNYVDGKGSASLTGPNVVTTSSLTVITPSTPITPISSSGTPGSVVSATGNVIVNTVAVSPTAITAISTTAVTVSFTSTSVAIIGQLTIKNPAGTTVAVTNTAISAGATSAVFTFVTPLTAVSAGTWTAGTATFVKTTDITTVVVTPVSLPQYSTATAVVVVKDQDGNTIPSTSYTLAYATANTAQATVASGVVTAAGTITTTAITVTATAIAPVVGTVAGTTSVAITADSVVPVISSVSNVNGNQLIVIFSEQVDKSKAETLTNYILRNANTGKQTLLNDKDGDSTNGSTNPSTMVLESDNKTLRVTLSTEQTDFLGVNGLSTLDSVTYRLFVNPASSATPDDFVKDLAGNKAATNTVKDFTGEIKADVTPPTLLTAGIATGSKQLTLTTNEKVYCDDVTKVTLSDGTTTFTLTTAGTADTVTQNASGSADTTVLFTINNATNITKLQSLTGTITVTLATGALKDKAGNQIVGIAKTADTIISPALSSATYDEYNNKLTLVFNKTMKVTSLTNFNAGIDFSNTADGGLVSDTITGGMTMVTTQDALSLEFTLNATAIAEMESNHVTDFDKYSVTINNTYITDVSGNNLGANSTKTLTYTKDSTKPTISTAVYTKSNGKLVITFSEPMVSGNLPADTKVAIKKKDTNGDLAQIHAALDALLYADGAADDANKSWNSDRTVLTIVVDKTADNASSEKAEVDTAGAAGTTMYLQFISGHGLLDTDQNAFDDTTKDNAKAITYTDDTVSGITIAQQSLRLVKATFDKNMDRSTVTASKFTIKQKNNTTVVKTPTAIIPTSDQKVFFIDLGTTASNNLTAGLDYVVITSAGMKDTVNVEVAAGQLASEITTAADDIIPVAAPTVAFVNDATAGVTAGDKIQLTFAEPVALNCTSAEFLEDKTAGSDNTKLGTGATIAMGDYANQVIITVGTSPTFMLDVGGDNLTVAVAKIRDYKNNNLNAVIDQLVNFPTEAAAPTLDTIKYADVNADGKISKDDTITMTFDKDIMSTGLDLTGITWETVDDTKAAVLNIASTAATVTASGKTVVIKLGEESAGGRAISTPNAAGTRVEYLNNLTVIINNATTTIKNLWGQKAVDVTDAANKAVTSADTTQPTVNSIKYKPGTRELTLVMSEAVNLIGANATDIAKMIVNKLTTANGNLGTKANVASAGLVANTSNKEVVITLHTDASIDQYTTISIDAGNFDADIATDTVYETILDASGNKAVRGQGTAYSVTIVQDVVTQTVNTEAELTAAVASTSVEVVMLGSGITLTGALDIKNVAKTINLNGKTLATAGNSITFTNNNSKITNGTMSGNFDVIGAGTGVSFEAVTFSGNVDNKIANRTYTNCTFGGNLTSTFALAINGASFTGATPVLTKTADISLVGNISLSDTTTLELAGTGKIVGTGVDKTLISSAGKFKVTTATTLEDLRLACKILLAGANVTLHDLTCINDTEIDAATNNILIDATTTLTILTGKKLTVKASTGQFKTSVDATTCDILGAGSIEMTNTGAATFRDLYVKTTGTNKITAGGAGLTLNKILFNENATIDVVSYDVTVATTDVTIANAKTLSLTGTTGKIAGAVNKGFIGTGTLKLTSALIFDGVGFNDDLALDVDSYVATFKTTDSTVLAAKTLTLKSTAGTGTIKGDLGKSFTGTGTIKLGSALKLDGIAFNDSMKLNVDTFTATLLTNNSTIANGKTLTLDSGAAGKILATAISGFTGTGNLTVANTGALTLQDLTVATTGTNTMTLGAALTLRDVTFNENTSIASSTYDIILDAAATTGVTVATAKTLTVTGTTGNITGNAKKITGTGTAALTLNSAGKVVKGITLETPAININDNTTFGNLGNYVTFAGTQKVTIASAKTLTFDGTANLNILQNGTTFKFAAADSAITGFDKVNRSKMLASASYPAIGETVAHVINFTLGTALAATDTILFTLDAPEVGTAAYVNTAAVVSSKNGANLADTTLAVTAGASAAFTLTASGAVATTATTATIADASVVTTAGGPYAVTIKVTDVSGGSGYTTFEVPVTFN